MCFNENQKNVVNKGFSQFYVNEKRMTDLVLTIKLPWKPKIGNLLLAHRRLKKFVASLAFNFIMLFQ